MGGRYRRTTHSLKVTEIIQWTTPSENVVTLVYENDIKNILKIEELHAAWVNRKIVFGVTGPACGTTAATVLDKVTYSLGYRNCR